MSNPVETVAGVRPVRRRPEEFVAWKQQGRALAALTAYDYPMARLLDEAGVPLILVGDSAGMVVHGLPDTTQVTITMMELHVTAVARGVSQALVVGDLPRESMSDTQTVLRDARRLIAAGAGAVKLEGARLDAVRALRSEGIAVMGHLGMLPQSVREEGGYRVKGKTPQAREQLFADAAALEAAGAFAIVLELVEPSVACELRHQLQVPTVGIGSGTGCDGQILVTHDLVGLFPWFRPKFVRPEAELGHQLLLAAREFVLRTDREFGTAARS